MLLKIVVSLLACLPFFSPLVAEELSLQGDCQWIKKYLVNIPNFPKPGFNFVCYHDILKDPEAFHRVIQTFAVRYREKELSAIVGLDARGFIFGAALAYELKLPFVMVRKAGKLPRETHKIDYALEFGTATFEIEVDSINKGDRVVVIDDVLATGGTAEMLPG